MWGAIKFWASRYSRWILVGSGLVVLTLVFVLFTRFSTSDDKQMKDQAKQVEQTKEVVAKQEEEVLGDSNFSEGVKNIPTNKELIALLDTHTSELGEGVYTTEKAYDYIEEEFGSSVRTLAEEGYILSDEMTADQRLMVQLNQEQILFAYGDIEEDDLLSVTVEDEGAVGLPKTLYNLRQYLGQRLTLNRYTYGVFNEEEHDTDRYNIFHHSTHTGEVSVGYEITDSVDLGDITLIGGYIAKGQNEDSGDKAMYAYLNFKPNKKMTGKEYAEALESLNVQLNQAEELSVIENGAEDLEYVPNVYPVQFTDSLYFYVSADGYDDTDEVSLSIDGKAIDFNVSGTDFESPIEE